MSTVTNGNRYKVEPCRSCHAPVIWAVTVNGRPQPVDAETCGDGNVILEPRDGRQPLVRVLPVAKRFGRKDLRKPHHATCPNSAAWRRKKVPA